MNRETEIRQINECIKALESEGIDWTNCEKLAYLYNVKHYVEKQMKEDDEEQAIKIHTDRRYFCESNETSGEIRRIVNSMNEIELKELVNSHARDLLERGFNGSYQILCDRIRRCEKR